HLVCALYLLLEALPRIFRTISFGDLFAKDFVCASQSRRSALDSEFEFIIGALQFLFETFVLGNVANVEKQCRFAEISNAACSNRPRNRSAMGSKTEPFELVWPVRLERHDSRAMFWRNQLCDMFADDFLAAHVVKPCSGGIAIQYIARHVFDEDRIWR